MTSGTPSNQPPDQARSRPQNQSSPGTPQKDPQTWATGDEPATPAQRSYLETLARDTGEEVPQDLTKARASELIDQMRDRSPRVPDDGS